MTPQQLNTMKLALEALDIAQGMLAVLRSHHQPKMLSAYTAIKEALAEHAMSEVQRLGQEIEPKIGCVNHDCAKCKERTEQEPDYWLGYGLQAHTEKPFENATALYKDPPQRTEQNFCSRCGKRTKDLITIHTCTPPKD